jgi:hypothetical protein
MEPVVVTAVTVARVAPAARRSRVSAVPVVMPVRVVTPAVALPTARPVARAVLVVPRAVVVPVALAVRRCRVSAVRAVRVVMPGLRAMVRPGPRVRLGHWCRATVVMAVQVAMVVPAARVVLPESVALVLPRATWALRALSAWRPTAASVLLVLPAVPALTPQV